MRARLLVLKQDELSRLESQLDQVDNEEERDLFLGNSRRDQNPERREILAKLDVALSSYGECCHPFDLSSGNRALHVANLTDYADTFLDRTRRILACDEPRRTDVKNLRNWVENTSSLAQDETAYLCHTQDLLTILSPGDDALARLAPLLEKIMRGLCRVFQKVSVAPTCLIQLELAFHPSLNFHTSLNATFPKIPISQFSLYLYRRS